MKLRVFISSVQKELAEERQRQAVPHIKQHGAITNAEYQLRAECSPRSALRDLAGLVDAQVVRLKGRGRGALYEYVPKRAGNAPNTPQTRQREYRRWLSDMYRTYPPPNPPRTRHDGMECAETHAQSPVSKEISADRLPLETRHLYIGYAPSKGAIMGSRIRRIVDV